MVHLAFQLELETKLSLNLAYLHLFYHSLNMGGFHSLGEVYLPWVRYISNLESMVLSADL